MEYVAVCSERVLKTWESIKESPYTPETKAILWSMKDEHYADYCALLGLIFDLAVYRNDELPESARGADPSAFCLTVPAREPDDYEPFPGELPESHNPQELWVFAAEKWNLASLFEEKIAIQQNWIRRQPTYEETAALWRLVRVAEGDGKQSRRVADFLLAWSMAGFYGGFDLSLVAALDPEVIEDVIVVFRLIARFGPHPGNINPSLEEAFDRLADKWRSDSGPLMLKH